MFARFSDTRLLMLPNSGGIVPASPCPLCATAVMRPAELHTTPAQPHTEVPRTDAPAQMVGVQAADAAHSAPQSPALSVRPQAAMPALPARLAVPPLARMLACSAGGSVPLRALLASPRLWMFTSAASGERSPVTAFPVRFSARSCTSDAKLGGMAPLMALASSASVCSAAREPMSAGMEPVSPLAPRSSV